MSYTVNATWAEGAWHVHVVEVDRVTQARTVAEIDTMARDVVEIMTGEPAAGVVLDVKLVLPDSVTAALARAAEQREVEAAARSAAARAVRDAAGELKRSGMTVRDLGKVLEVSPQRASQLTSCERTA